MKRFKIKDLQKKYWLRYILWHIFNKQIFLLIAKSWGKHAIVAFPLTIDIEVGNMMYFYLLNGWGKTLDRCVDYNLVIGKHLRGEGRDDEGIDLQCLTKKARYQAELDREMSGLINEYY